MENVREDWWSPHR